eukprot:2201006-Alexandrium_andersonii.AAC.1
MPNTHREVYATGAPTRVSVVGGRRGGRNTLAPRIYSHGPAPLSKLAGAPESNPGGSSPSSPDGPNGPP